MKTFNDDNTLSVKFKLNTQLIEKKVKPRKLLSDFLRYDCGQTGTHVGCEHGICGACTVLLNDQPIRSCLMLAPQVDNSEVITIEGIFESDEFDDLKDAFKKFHALQCGYCTPGFVTTIVYLLRSKIFLNEDEIRKKLSGNICRCTGYTGIVKAVHEVMKTRFDKK